jgi:hypothetical protein
VSPIADLAKQRYVDVLKIRTGTTMQRLCAALFLMAASAVQAQVLVPIPGAGISINPQNGAVYPHVGSVAVDPATGRASPLIDASPPAHAPTPLYYESAPAPRPAYVARAVPVPLNCEDLYYRIDYLHGTLQFLGEHDPDFPAVRQNWRAAKADYARRCR